MQPTLKKKKKKNLSNLQGSSSGTGPLGLTSVHKYNHAKPDIGQSPVVNISPETNSLKDNERVSFHMHITCFLTYNPQL